MHKTVISLTVGLKTTSRSRRLSSWGALHVQHIYIVIDNIRPSLPTKSSDSELALVTSNGRGPLVNYADLIKTLLRHYNLPSLPTLTTARKAGATGFLARDLKTQERMEQLSRHMSHQHATNIRYYRLTGGRRPGHSRHHRRQVRKCRILSMQCRYAARAAPLMMITAGSWLEVVLCRPTVKLMTSDPESWCALASVSVILTPTAGRCQLPYVNSIKM